MHTPLILPLSLANANLNHTQELTSQLFFRTEAVFIPSSLQPWFLDILILQWKERFDVCSQRDVGGRVHEVKINKKSLMKRLHYLLRCIFHCTCLFLSELTQDEWKFVLPVVFQLACTNNDGSGWPESTRPEKNNVPNVTNGCVAFPQQRHVLYCGRRRQGEWKRSVRQK